MCVGKYSRNIWLFQPCLRKILVVKKLVFPQGFYTTQCRVALGWHSAHVLVLPLAQEPQLLWKGALPREESLMEPAQRLHLARLGASYTMQ